MGCLLDYVEFGEDCVDVAEEGEIGQEAVGSGPKSYWKYILYLSSF